MAGDGAGRLHLTLERHIRACNDAVLPGGRLRLVVEGAPAGWVVPATAAELHRHGARLGNGEVHASLAILDACAVALAEHGRILRRGEDFAVRAEDGRRIGVLDRGAMTPFGLRVENVHLNGLVQRADGPHMWVATRAASKPVAPGKLDNLVAGGVPAGLTPWQTLVKECGEEAGLPAGLAEQAKPHGRIAYAMAWQDGLRREALHCFDVWLPDDFVPAPVDGEVEGFTLWPMARVVQTVRETDAFMYDVNLVLIDLFIRLGLLPAEEMAALRPALEAGGRD